MSDSKLRYVDPNTEGVHPLRHSLTDEDWERLNRIVLENSKETCTLEEIDAFGDWLYDEVAAELQTHEGVTTLQ